MTFLDLEGELCPQSFSFFSSLVLVVGVTLNWIAILVLRTSLRGNSTKVMTSLLLASAVLDWLIMTCCVSYQWFRCQYLIDFRTFSNGNK